MDKDNIDQQQQQDKTVFTNHIWFYLFGLRTFCKAILEK